MCNQLSEQGRLLQGVQLRSRASEEARAAATTQTAAATLGTVCVRPSAVTLCHTQLCGLLLQIISTLLLMIDNIT